MPNARGALLAIAKKEQQISMPSNRLNEIIEHLKAQKVIDNKTVIHLYNWAEPMTSPYFGNICESLSDNQTPFIISTNGSMPLKLFESQIGAMKLLQGIVFSLPGFSQKSYDRVHDFDFEKVIKNIEKIVTTCRGFGFNGYVQISYHVYQFNLDEIEPAAEWAKKRGYVFSPTYAYFNDFVMAYDFLTGADLKSKDVTGPFLDYIEELVKQRPVDYKCPQSKILAINTKGELLLCCCASNFAPLGKIIDMTAEQIEQSKTSSWFCTECQKIGLDYWFHNPKQYIIKPKTFIERLLRKIKALR